MRHRFTKYHVERIAISSPLFFIYFCHSIAFNRGFMIPTEENQPLRTREHCYHSE